jgi:MFS family permease
MTPEAARADRNESIRAAARSWKKAGAIDDTALAPVEAAYPDDRHGVGPVFRVLLFLFTLISVSGAFGFFMAIAGTAEEKAWPVLLLLFGAGLIAATEFQITGMKRAGGGVEAATSLAGIGFLAGFVFWLCGKVGLSEDPAFAVALLAAALLLAGAAWRWGYPLYAGASLAALLGSPLLLLHGARPVWIVLSLALAPILTRFSESPRLPPSHRSSCAFALAVALAALYAAVHVGSLDGFLLEGWWRLPIMRPRSPSPVLRALSIAATALVPVIYLAIGLRSRRYVFLTLGAATAAVSLVTLRYYVHLAPLWVILILAGAALIALVSGLRRYLDSGAGKERHGYTAEPLFEEMGRRRMLEAGAAVLSLSPEARPLHEEPKFAGGGGSFGGGGASGEF